MNYCPNIEVLKLPQKHEICDYVVTLGHKKKQEEDMVLWKNLQKIEIYLQHPGNSVYRCFYFFSKQLESLIIIIKAQMKIVKFQGMQQSKDVTEEEENSQGSRQDMAEYIGSFKHLESLHLENLLLALCIIWKSTSLAAQII